MPKPKEAPVGREIYANEKSAFHDDDETEELVDSRVAEEEAFAESAKEENPDPQGHIWLDKLRARLDPKLIESRKASWSPTGKVDYVSWASVADILDNVLGGCWNFSIDKLEVGNKVAYCQGTLTVELGDKDNRMWVNRSGVGVGEIRGDNSSNFDNAIKTAASDCLKRCAVLFGVARDLYIDEPDGAEQEKPTRDADFFRDNTDSRGARTEEYRPQNRAPQRSFGAPKNPNEPISDKQIGLLRVLGRKANCDVDGECAAKYDKDLVDLTKGEASEFIGYMQEMAGE